MRAEKISLVRVELDLLLINVLSILLIFITVFLPSNILRPVLAFPFVTFFPGYIFLKVSFSEKEINLLERIALSFGLSMIIVTLAGLIIAYSPLKLTLYHSLLSIYFFILITSIIGQYHPTFSVRGKLQTYSSLKRTNLILACSLITLLGIFIRFYPVLDYSLFCGSWMPGNHLYHTYYTLQTGELLEKEGIHTPTEFSNTIYNTIHNRGFILFQIIFSLIFGLTNLEEFLFYNKFFPWCGALLFPLCVLLVANKIAKELGGKLSAHHYLIFYFVANFASLKLLVDSSFMTNNVIMSLSHIFFVIYFLLDKDKRLKNQLLGVLFGFFVFIYYYTAGIIFLIILLTLGLVQRIKKERLISEAYISTYSISFIAYYMYTAEITFRALTLTLKSAIYSPGAPPAQLSLGRSIMEFTIPHLSAYLNTLLIGIFIITFVYWWVRGEIERNAYTNFIIYVILGLVLSGFALFLWEGLKATVRLNTYAVIPFLLALSLLTVSSQKGSDKKKKVAIVLSLLIATTSIVAYVPGTVILPSYLTYPEKNAIIWYCKHESEKGFVFTDFRIGAAPIMLDCFVFTGITGREIELKEYLINVYYGDSALKASETLAEYGASYILLSEEMEYTAIAPMSMGHYQPIPPEGVAKYANSSLFGKIYDNSKAWYYILQGR